MKGNNMKKVKAKTEMRSEYDFSKAVKGKHAESYAKGTNVVLLDKDVAKVFKDSGTVNSALRSIAGLNTKRKIGLVK